MQGYDFGVTDKSKTIGMISPFSQQANVLRYRLTKRWQNFSWNDIGTVYTFQGQRKQRSFSFLISAIRSIVFGSLS
ncbi:AAA domain-containing protein [Nostoc sp. UIC 10890]